MIVLEIKYKIKGIVLHEPELREIHSYYEIACTAEYLMENYEIDEEDAIKTAGKVRRLMDKYGYNEEEAVSEIMMPKRKEKYNV